MHTESPGLPLPTWCCWTVFLHRHTLISCSERGPSPKGITFFTGTETRVCEKGFPTPLPLRPVFNSPGKNVAEKGFCSVGSQDVQHRAPGNGLLVNIHHFSNSSSRFGCSEMLKLNVQYFMNALSGNVYLIWYVLIAKENEKVGKMRMEQQWLQDAPPGISLFRCYSQDRWDLPSMWLWFRWYQPQCECHEMITLRKPPGRCGQI